MLPIPYSNFAFWYWTSVATLWAMYGAYLAVVWYYLRSPMAALAAWLMLWLFLATSTFALMQSTSSIIPFRYLIMIERSVWLPALITMWLIVSVGVKRSNGRIKRLRRLWRWWECWRKDIDAAHKTEVVHE